MRNNGHEELTMRSDISRTMRRTALCVLCLCAWCATALVSQAALAQTAPPQASNSSTRQLALSPGLVFTCLIYGGHDASGKLLGDYEDTITITDVAASGVGFNWSMTYPVNASGHRFVRGDDVRLSHKVSLYYGPGGVPSGYADWIRIPDLVYADLKAGRNTGLEFDGNVRTVSAQKVAEEDLAVRVNEQPVKIHTLKSRTANGWDLWILDNPAFPIIVKADAANVIHWTVPAFSYPGADARNLLTGLKQTGEATSHAILFAFNSAELKNESRSILDALADYLKTNSGVRLAIEGHTDNVGGEPFNLDLSRHRADSVKQYLVQAHIDAARLTTTGLGLTKPVASNATPEGRAQNRRVVFKQVR
jgi:outer membrane protein OmpA-like peptidoglycan-associated protein